MLAVTLSTTIAVKTPVPAEKLFRFGQSLLSATPEAQRWEHRPPGYIHEWDKSQTPSRNGMWMNCLGQGLPGILEVEYGADGPLDLGPPSTDDDEYAAYEAEQRTHLAGCLQIELDTAYGYKTANGAHCGDLHAWLVVMLCDWLEDHNAQYEWNADITDRWHDSTADMSDLGDPVLGALSHFAAATP